MTLTKITINENEYPEVFRPYFSGTDLYDSSCSPAAKVIFIDRDGGYFLKRSAKGTLSREAMMTGIFHENGMAARVVAFESDGADYLLTEKVHGEDCVSEKHLSDPKLLSETTGMILSELHSKKICGVSLPDRTEEILANVEKNYKNGSFDNHFLHGMSKIDTIDDAWKTVNETKHLLKNDVLMHGDYCLPNVILKDWKLSGFIDLGGAGVGDRHFDVFWGLWTLIYNLKTDAYCGRFLDAYGREKIDFDLLRAIAAFECLN